MSYKSLLNYTPSTLNGNDNYFSNFSKNQGKLTQDTKVIERAIELFQKNPDLMNTYVTLVGYFNNHQIDSNGNPDYNSSSAMTLEKKFSGNSKINGLISCMLNGTRYFGFADNKIYYSDDNNAYSKYGQFKECNIKCPEGFTKATKYNNQSGCFCVSLESKECNHDCIKNKCSEQGMTFIDGNNFVPIGSYKDQSDRALPIYIPEAHDADNCSDISRNLGFRYFGLQCPDCGVQCWAGNNLEQAQKYGKANSGKTGGSWINYIYENKMLASSACKQNDISKNKLTVYRFDPNVINLVYNTFWNINNSNNGFNISKNIMEGFSDSLYGDLTNYKTTMNNNWQTEYSDNVKNNQLNNIVSNLNSISTNLAKDYNKKTKIYNQQVDIINRNQKLVDEKNEIINNQLDSLQDLQNNISNKERLIELNKANYTKDNRSIKLLGGAFIMFFALVIPIFLLITKTISLNLGLLLILAIIIAYVIYAIIISNKMKVLKFTKPLRKDISKYEKAISKFYKNDIRDKIANYAYGDCVCPEEEEENPNPNPGPDVPPGTVKFVLNQNDGFWYYDGSAPPQQIYPKPRGYVTIVGMGNMSNVPVKVPENLNVVQNKIERELLRLLKRKMEENDIPNNPKPLRIIDWISGANMGMSKSSKNTPDPVWNPTGLPKITSDRVLINKVCQSYDSTNTDSDIQTFIKEAYSLLLDEDVAQQIVNKNGIQENKLDYLTRKYGQIINKNGKEEAYNEVLMNIMNSKQFIDKYGSNNTLDNLIVSIMIRYSTKSTNDYSFSSVYTPGVNTNNNINTGCDSSEYGCCPDGKSYATGPNFEGCN